MLTLLSFNGVEEPGLWVNCYFFTWMGLDLALSSEAILSCFSGLGNGSTYSPAWFLVWSAAYEDTGIISVIADQTHNLNLSASFPNFITSKSCFLSGPSSVLPPRWRLWWPLGISRFLLHNLPQPLQSSIWCIILSMGFSVWSTRCWSVIAGKDWRQEKKGMTSWKKSKTEDDLMDLSVSKLWSWWWTGKPGVLQSMESQSRTRLSDWTELIYV